MKPLTRDVDINGLTTAVKGWLDVRADARLGLLTSVDGRQIITLVLDPRAQSAECWISEVKGDSYKSLTSLVPQSHWFERAIYDLFGLIAEQHPRLKHILLHDEYEQTFHPLNWRAIEEEFTHEQYSLTSEELLLKSLSTTGAKRKYKFLQVKGEGIYELPVGPIHAGIIEPGHFRFNCFGETILNLEIRLGYVHRGIEKRLTQVPWQKARFVAEAAASDTTCANALAHATAIESLLKVEPSSLAQSLRTIALEIERLAMHIMDIGGLSADMGFLALSSAAGRLRGMALGLAQMLSGSRFMRGFILPGGVRKFAVHDMQTIRNNVRQLRQELLIVLEMLEEKQVARERMEKVGVISTSLAREFGMVGVTARASGINYDCRQYFAHANYPSAAPPVVVERSGDILARTRVRMGEIKSSCDVIESTLDQLPDGPVTVDLPSNLPANEIGMAVVEACRGELIHLLFTDQQGAIKRYAIKDPSFNNWTAISIAVRNNLISDFPLVNKSLALSYSGNDL